MSEISCMSFNILACDTHDSGYEKPACRYPYVIQTIREQMPDLVGLQEACDQACNEEKQATRCYGFNWCEQMQTGVSELGYTTVVIRDQEGFLREKQNIGCGLIIGFKSDRFELIDNGCECYMHDNVRYFQWVKLHDKKYDRNVLFTNTHFSINKSVAGTKSPMAGNGFRIVQAVKLLKFWYKHCPEDWALFSTGDYNSTTDSDPQKLLGSRDFKASYLVAEVTDEHATMNFAKSQHCLDYCYINPRAQAVRKFEVIRRKFDSDAPEKLAGYASDHRAIMTYCDYKPVETEAEQ